MKPETRQCQEHGSYQSEPVTLTGRHFFWTSCPGCQAKRKAAEEKEEAERRRREKEAEKRLRLKDSGIPPRFADASLEAWQVKNAGQERVLEFAKNYIRDFREICGGGRCAAFVGNPGTGKTYLASAIGLALIDLGLSVVYAKVQDVMLRIKASWRDRNGEETELEIISGLTDPHLLILDEIGVQFGSDFERQMLCHIFDERYIRRRPTLILSNLPTFEMKRFLGERVADRMNDNGLGVIEFDWESQR